MRNWFTSLNGAVTISALSLLSFIGYTLAIMRYYLEHWIPGDFAAMTEIIAVMLIVGGWLRGLFVAVSGRRGGLIALVVFSGFAILATLYDMQFVLFKPMAWPEQVMIVVALGMAVLALAALASQLRQKKTQ
jgi:hypothetical protein